MKKGPKKIILNTENDLLRYDIKDYNNAKLYNFQGDFFQKIYKEALEIEGKNIDIDSIKINSNSNDKSQDFEIKFVQFEIYYKTEVLITFTYSLVNALKF